MRPEFVERPWGTLDLAPMYPEHRCEKPVGEVWLTGDENRVANGPLAGRKLGELCREFGRALVGKSARETERFPLLIKFLFSREKLSVQVHPDDESARRAGLPCGKTECWYVVAAEPGAQVALGLRSGVTREQLARAIRDVQAEESLNWVDIHPGEMIYVDAGTVHTIGPGAVLLETQQNSDTTYRLYDYGRPREIHVEQGLAAMKERTRAGKVRSVGDWRMSNLIATGCFDVTRCKATGEQRGVLMTTNFPEWKSAEIIVGLEGSGKVKAPGSSPVAFTCGEAVVVPASFEEFEVYTHHGVEILAICLPLTVDPTAGPATDRLEPVGS